MSLSTALNIAQNSLLNTQRQTSVVSKNMANAYNGDYSRRNAALSSLAPGAQVATIARVTNSALFKQNLSAISGWTAQSTIVDGLDQLRITVNGVDNATSPAMLVGRLQEALQFYSATPSNRTAAENAVEAARQVSLGLNQATSALQAFRADTDSQIATAVTELNQLLADFKTANDEIVKATAVGREALDSLDRRDALLKKIAEIVPISTISRPGGDTMIVTADGSTLFETIPRHVHFEATPAFGAGTAGNKVYVDGVPLFTATGANTSAAGTLSALVQLRDDYAVGLQSQLDEVARGLIATFAETDPTPPGSTLAGLFFAANATPTNVPGFPAYAGLAGEIRIHAAVDPSQGGDATKLKDGANVNLNTGSNASYNQSLLTYLDRLDSANAFMSASGSTVNQSLMSFTTSMISWIEDARKNAATGAESKSALVVRSTEALSNLTGVNIDEEMALMLELEHSYAASAKMLQVVDEMLRTLLEAVR